MQISLWAHPANPSAAVDEIRATVERLAPTTLRFRYLVLGHIDELVIPPQAPPIRANNLWRTTCFEAFLAADDLPGYLELNFAPSSQWAAYDFSAYRDGMVQASLPAPPDIEMAQGTGRLEVVATISLDAVRESRRLSLCAVIEERSGNKSYWADRHAGSAPDFHRQDCFALELPAARPA